MELLAEHITHTRDRQLSQEAKAFLGFNRVFRNMQWLTGLLAAGMALAFVLLVYLYMMEQTDTLYIVLAVVGIGSFLMIRRTQRYSTVLGREVRNVSKRLLKMIGAS